MAAWHDLEPRIAKLEATGRKVALQYHGQGLPRWLEAVMENDILVVNCKGVRLDNTLCVIKLSDLEALLGDGSLSKEQKENEVETQLNRSPF